MHAITLHAATMLKGWTAKLKREVKLKGEIKTEPDNIIISLKDKLASAHECVHDFLPSDVLLRALITQWRIRNWVWPRPARLVVTKVE